MLTEARADINLESLEFDDDHDGVHANEFVFGWKRLRTPLMAAVRCAGFRRDFALEDAIGSHVCSLEALVCVCDQCHSDRGVTL
jgi:hypothetical protein